MWLYHNDGKEELMTRLTGCDCANPPDGSEPVDLAVQSDAIEADINTLVRRFGLSVDVPLPAETLAHYGDYSGLVDYHSAKQMLIDAQDAFEDLPAHLRGRFNNDPGQLLDFLHDPNNRSEAVKLGLVEAALLPPQAPSDDSSKGASEPPPE